MNSIEQDHDNEGNHHIREILREINVVSFTNSEITYNIIEYDDNTWSCTCPDYILRRQKAGTHCKHIRFVRNPEIYPRPSINDPSPGGTFFKLNDYLKLKLHYCRTIIFVNNQQFYQCKYLLFNLNKVDVPLYDEINSIDEAEEIYARSHEGFEGKRSVPHEGTQIEISAETEFWAHCSNLQAWVENDYDTRILHRNLSFPLLKRLTEIGDPKAKRVFKEEIALRIESGYEPVITFLVEGGYLDYFSDDEMEVLFSTPSGDKLKEIYARREIES